MDRQKWAIEEFVLSELPIWTCPTCNSATLFRHGDFLTQPTALYQAIPDSYFDENEMQEVPIDPDIYATLKYRFVGFLKCSSPNCNEFVSICGTVSKGFYGYEDPVLGLTSAEADFYKPEYFNPPLKVINISEHFPKKIQEELNASFNLFWIDKSACANKIRTVIESLLDDKKVARKRKKKNLKFYNLTLHDRLSLFKTKDPETASFLLSTKWIGNTGSHKDEVKTAQVIDAYELLEHSLNRIYIKDHIRISRMSKKINKKKKPI